MVKADFIPEDFKLCQRCVFQQQCPYDYHCKTYERTQMAEWLDDIRNGDSTEKVR